MSDTKVTREVLLPFQVDLLSELLELRTDLGVRRKYSRPVLMAAGAAALTTIAAMVLAPRDQAPLPHDVRSPQLLFLAAEVASAVEDTDETVLHTVEIGYVPDGPESRFEGWWDKGGTEHQRLIETDVSGQPIRETVYRRQGDKGVLTVVDHGSRTWWTRSRDVGSKIHGAPWCFIEDSGDRTLSVCDLPAMTSGTSGTKLVAPAMIQFRNEVADGGLETVGRETIDGRETLHVRDSSKPGMRRDFWVDAGTFRPVKKVTTDMFGNRFEMSFRWLPRTEESLRLLEPSVSGYSKVEPPQDSPRTGEGPFG